MVHSETIWQLMACEEANFRRYCVSLENILCVVSQASLFCPGTHLARADDNVGTLR